MDLKNPGFSGPYTGKYRSEKTPIRAYFYTKVGDTIRGGSRAAATSKVELFVIIINRWKPLTIITKSSTLDVAAVLDRPLTIMLLQAWESHNAFVFHASNPDKIF